MGWYSWIHSYYPISRVFGYNVLHFRFLSLNCKNDCPVVVQNVLKTSSSKILKKTREESQYSRNCFFPIKCNINRSKVKCQSPTILTLISSISDLWFQVVSFPKTSSFLIIFIFFRDKQWLALVIAWHKSSFGTTMISLMTKHKYLQTFGTIMSFPKALYIYLLN